MSADLDGVYDADRRERWEIDQPSCRADSMGPKGDPMPKKDNVRALADIHTQLASESRLRILKALSEKPASVAFLSGLLAITASAVSAQLQKLRMVGLVDFTRDNGIVYHLTEPVHPVVSATLALMEDRP